MRSVRISFSRLLDARLAKDASPSDEDHGHEVSLEFLEAYPGRKVTEGSIPRPLLEASFLRLRLRLEYSMSGFGAQIQADSSNI